MILARLAIVTSRTLLVLSMCTTSAFHVTLVANRKIRHNKISPEEPTYGLESTLLDFHPYVTVVLREC